MNGPVEFSHDSYGDVMLIAAGAYFEQQKLITYLKTDCTGNNDKEDNVRL